MYKIQLKRTYEPADKNDGYRILVDRLWPRGLTKEKAAVDEWLKDIAPTTELRKWFKHDPKKWTEFKKRYRDELKEHMPLVEYILKKARKERVTLLYSAKDEEHNDALVLKDFIDKHA